MTENPRGFKKPIRRLYGHEDVINRMAWSPKGGRLATTSFDHTVKVWDFTQRGSNPLVLERHSDWVSSATWSPDSRILATGSGDASICLWDIATGQFIRSLDEHTRTVFDVAWSPLGNMLASASGDGNVILWNMANCKPTHVLTGHLGPVYCLAWSPDGKLLASGSQDSSINIWDTYTGELIHVWEGHAGPVYSLDWSARTNTLASASADQTVRLWSRVPMGTLEGHTAVITTVSFSHDDNFLATKSLDGSVRIWRCDTWDMVVILEEEAAHYWTASGAFHPTMGYLATLDNHDKQIRIWRFDPEVLLEVEPAQQTVRYTNAKVVLVGDSGVGKTSLANALMGHKFEGTTSTHGRHVIRYDSKKLTIDEEGQIFEVREIWLWDIAGQPDYRIVHQLHLDEVTLALVMFDVSTMDPFSGVYYWHRALQHSRQVVNSRIDIPLKKVLVAGRIDRGGVGTSQERVDRLRKDLEFDAYIKTSSAEDQGIMALENLVHTMIDWDALPRVRSTALFQRIKNFLGRMRDEGKLLNRIEQLYDTYVIQQEIDEASDELLAQFQTCISLVEAQGLLKRFTFGDLVLLRPELLDAYASAIITAAREETGGLGVIAEDYAHSGEFQMSQSERIAEKSQEQLLLYATIQDLVIYELVLRYTNAEGQKVLLFPSQATRLYPFGLPQREKAAAIWSMEGAILFIYTTLIVRLWNTGLFSAIDLYERVALLTTQEGDLYQICLSDLGDGQAELILFLEEDADQGVRLSIGEYIETHLVRRALSGSVRQKEIMACQNCDTAITEDQIIARRRKGFDWLTCPVCESPVKIGRAPRRISTSRSLLRHRWVSQMDQEADETRNRTASVYTLQGKRATNDFDLYLSYFHGDNEIEVLEIAERLKERGYLPWMDILEYNNGHMPSEDQILKELYKCKKLAFCIGENKSDTRQRRELDEFVKEELVKLERDVIPVILPSAPRDVKMPPNLRRLGVVDFRNPRSRPLDKLIYSIDPTQR